MAESKRLYDHGTIFDLQKWLERLYGQDDCPVINPDVHNIELLLKLKTNNEEAEKNKKEIIKTKKNLLQFYNSKTEELKCLVKCENVSLNEETLKHVEGLSELAVKMKLEKPDSTNFFLAASDMKITHLKKQEQKLMDSVELSSLSKKILKTKKNNDDLKRELETLSKTVNIQEANKLKIIDLKTFMKRKSKEYEHNAELYQKYLNDRNFSPSLKHSSLVEKHKAVQALEKEVQEAVNKLKSYQALPPDIYLAKLEVQQKREELDLYEKELNLLIETWERDADAIK